MPEDVQNLKKALALYRGLVEVSSLINSITEFDDLLRAVLDVSRRVFRVQASSMFLVDEASGDLDLVIASSDDGKFEKPQIRVPKGEGISGWVLAHGESLLIPDAYADPRFFRDADQKSGFRTRSILCAPLRHEGEIIGVIQVINPVEKEAFEPVDLEALEAYSDLIATAMEKLRAIDRIRQQERMERDVAIAAEIQRELLSQAIPDHVDGASFAAFNRPATEVGGDFYLVSQRPAGDIYFAIGDVSGKGVPASLLMAQTLSAMRLVFADAASPAEAMGRLNEALVLNVVRGMFVTLLVGKMEPTSQTISLSSAGHCRPWHCQEDGSAEEIALPGALPLGVLPGVAYEEKSLQFAEGDFLATFTDGLTESRENDSGRFFDERLAEFLNSKFDGPKTILDLLVASEGTHRGDSPARDDLTILVGGFR